MTNQVTTHISHFRPLLQNKHNASDKYSCSEDSQAATQTQLNPVINSNHLHAIHLINQMVTMEVLKKKTQKQSQIQEDFIS